MFERKYFSETTALNLPSFNPTSLLYFTEAQAGSPDTFAFEEGYFLLRNQELEENQLAFESKSLDYASIFKPTPDILSNFSDMTYLSQKIYDNRKVTILAV